MDMGNGMKYNSQKNHSELLKSFTFSLEINFFGKLVKAITF